MLQFYVVLNVRTKNKQTKKFDFQLKIHFIIIVVMSLSFFPLNLSE